MSKFEQFLSGKLFENVTYAKTSTVTRNQPFIDGNLYQVGITRYVDETGLYVVANESSLLNELMTSLQFSGLGGKRSSGYGRFELVIQDIPKRLIEQLTTHSSDSVMVLTSSLPIESDLAQAMSEGQYLLSKFSGFAFSSSTRENYRKQDLYKFTSGSTFSRSFVGQIVDVRPLTFPHPVFNFSKPLFYKLEV